MTKKYVYVCGIRFFIGDYKNIVSIIKTHPFEKTIFAPLATHPVMEAYFNNALKDVYKGIQYLLPDGYIVWAIHFLFGINIQQRIYGPDLLLNVSRMCEKVRKPIFLCGNNCSLVENKLKKLFPNLIIGGVFEMRGIQYGDSISKKISILIKKTNSACVCVGIGSPNQHILASSLTIKLPIICVGAGFDLIAGIENQAPIWIREGGLEWLYRLLQNPRRLWKRYIILAPLFVLLIFRDRFMKQIHIS